MIRHDPIPWEQLTLFPPETIRIEVVVFIDGPTESATCGYKVTDAHTDDVLALGVDAPVPATWAQSEGIAMLSTWIGKASATLGPF